MSDPATTSSSEDESPLPTKRAVYIVDSEEEEEEEQEEGKELTPESDFGTGSTRSGVIEEDDDDWGSFKAASGDEGEEAQDDDWGSVKAASEEEEEEQEEGKELTRESDFGTGSTRSGVIEEGDDDWGSFKAASGDEGEEAQDDDWGSVVAASDREEEGMVAVEEEGGDEEGQAGEEEGQVGEEDDPEEEDEDEPEEEDEDEPEEDEEEDSTKSLLEIAAAQSLPTPEQSDAPHPATRSRFVRSASRKFRAESASGARPPPPATVKGRRRGAQINRFTKEYLDLLNSEIRLAAARETYSTTEKFQLREGSYVLGSWWTPEEKEVFFNHLAVLGKDRLDRIAKAVGSKTVVECAAYLQVLQQGLDESHEWVRSRGRDTVGMKDIPAAVELSEDCVDALDKQAELLQDRLSLDEERQEKRQWGDFWLLDSDIAEGITALYKSGDMDAVHDVAPEAELLHIGKMLQLSEHVFMNGHGDDNFRAFAERDELPSIRYKAFQDYYQLVLIMTRRLVQTAIFMAESRLRSMENGIFAPKPYIRTDDVHAAVESLGMPKDAKKYWLNLPRRKGFSVVQHKLDMNYKNPKTMDLDEVEEFLSRKPKEKPRGKYGSKYNSNSSQATASVSGREDAEATNAKPDTQSDSEMSFVADETEGNDSDADVDSEDLDARQRHREELQRHREERQRIWEEKQDRFLEKLDSRTALNAEKELWRIMGYTEETVAAAISGDEGTDGYQTDSSIEEGALKAPQREARTEQRIQDWRAKVEYKAPWELKNRTKQQWQEDDFLSFQAQAEREIVEGPPQKRRKIGVDVEEEDEEEEEEQTEEDEDADEERETPRPTKSTAAKRKRKAEPAAVVRSPRKRRTRRQSTAPVGFVSTVDAVSDAEAALDCEPEAEEDEDVYQGSD